MTRKWFLLPILLLTISLNACGQKKKDSVDETEMKPYQLLDIQENVSLVKLIANPEKYNGKRIQVIGYLHLEFEGNAIYLHEEDFKRRISANSFWVEFSSKLTKKRDLNKFNDKYVIIIGTFNVNEKGHMRMFGGTLDDIVRLDLWDIK
ncbi:MAG: hypothetical protein HYI21_03230 [Sediminibacterium sp. Gen4]|jgi:hypothetical protein|uniref:hypothetical protein n=1 Tax=unclassified Sediminibacterium TaxID=2635961 RepID=UPI0015BF71FC|nr:MULTISPECIES: hypothetical protein [unclassified Sediminibacterium]MBW0164536.1 hypothetical protein [Sediminibacterium sp.]NWK65018.1 hypothetical protein [Sediminibacterium sp. Gen4]